MSALDQIRSAPPWLIIAALVLIAVLLIGALPFAGYLVERKRRKEASQVASANGAGEAFFHGIPDVHPFDRPAPAEPERRRLAIGMPWGATDETWAGTPLILTETAGSVTQVLPAPFEGEEPAEPTLAEIDAEVERAEQAEDEAESCWVGEATAAWSIHDIFEGELEEKSPEMRAFEDDPLGAWYVPAELSKYDFLPEADRTFRDLVVWGKLTGVGAEIDAEWESWNLTGATR